MTGGSTQTALSSHPFMCIPPELRVRIYDLVLVFEEPIEITGKHRREWLSMEERTTRSGRNVRPKEDKNEKRRCIGHTALSIALTCRQIYLEAAPRYYAFNTFALLGFSCGRAIFLTDIRMNNKDEITSFQLYGNTPWRLLHLGTLPGLKTLKLAPVGSREGWLYGDPPFKNRIAALETYCMASKRLKTVTITPVRHLCSPDRPEARFFTGRERGDRALETGLNLQLQARTRARGQQVRFLACSKLQR